VRVTRSCCTLSIVVLYPALGMSGVQTRTSLRPSRGRRVSRAGDRLVVLADVVRLIWMHKLWWMVPLLLALLVLGLLVMLEATPIGPLLYPVF
jgi:hypothetical protein